MSPTGNAPVGAGALRMSISEATAGLTVAVCRVAASVSAARPAPALYRHGNTAGAVGTRRECDTDGGMPSASPRSGRGFNCVWRGCGP